MAETATHKPGEHPDLPAPASTVGVIGWLRGNLLSSPLNIALTLVGIFLVYILIPPVINWAVVTAVFSGDTRDRCDMGRQLTRMGGAMAQIDLDKLGDPAMAKPVQEVQDFLGQFVSQVSAKGADVPADLQQMTASADAAAVQKALTDAFNKNDAGAVEANFAALAPLVDWGSTRDGACWTFIKTWFKQIIYGRYPDKELWRINLAFIILIAASVPLFIPRVKGKIWIGAFLLIVFPMIALYLFAGISKSTVEAWPYRLMGWSAVLLAVASLLPQFPRFRKWGGAISIALLILLPLWGLSAPSTWTQGLTYGAPAWSVVLAILLGIVPAFAAAAGLFVGSLRDLIYERLWQICTCVGILALVGFALPILAWDHLAGPSPPWAMVIAPAALAVVALAPWGYDRSAGLAGRIAYLLLPVYLFVVYLAFAGPPDFLNLGILDWGANTTPVFRGLAQVLPFVETPLWGGLFLTLVIAGVGIVASLPIGIVLALGRRSNMPVVRAACVAFIELWRGVPLISVLFMASVMFPLFLPEGMNFDKLVRALVGVALFSSAYMAEVVRGGLQAIPRGQYEAAEAMALTFWKSMNLVILPQALKLVIPGIVNTFIGLFKDTTLVLIIGLFDLLGAVQLAATNQRWLGFSVEGYVFAALGFWIFCFCMSRYSIHIENKLETGHKR